MIQRETGYFINRNFETEVATRWKKPFFIRLYVYPSGLVRFYFPTPSIRVGESFIFQQTTSTPRGLFIRTLCVRGCQTDHQMQTKVNDLGRKLFSFLLNFHYRRRIYSNKKLYVCGKFVSCNWIEFQESSPSPSIFVLIVVIAHANNNRR